MSNLQSTTTSEPTTELITYECRECGYIGSVEVVEKKATCPTCGTVNDVWKDGEMPPQNHRSEPTTDNVIQQVEGRPTLIEAARVAREAADAILNRGNPTTGEIVRALRYCADVNSICGDACPAHIDAAGCRAVLMQNAADRLESQEQTIDELEDECGKLKMTINLLTARAEQAERERDKAKADMRFAANCVDGLCKICGNAECQERGDGCFMCRSFTWRGLPQDGEGKHV